MELTPEQLYELERLWFYYGNNGPKHTPGNHGFLQGLIERRQDERPAYGKHTTPTPECAAAAEAILEGRISTDGLSESQKALRAISIARLAQRDEAEREWLARIRGQ